MSPATTPVDGDADFTSASAAVWVAVTVLVAVWVTGVLAGLRPLMVAVLRNDPASTSAWVTVYEPVQVIVAFGARVAGAAGVQESAPTSGSVTVTLCKVVAPVFVPVIVYATVSPATTPVLGDAVLVSESRSV